MARALDNLGIDYVEGDGPVLIQRTMFFFVSFQNLVVPSLRLLE